MILVLRPMNPRSWREELAARGSPEELLLFLSTLVEEPLLFVPTFPEELPLCLPVLPATDEDKPAWQREKPELTCGQRAWLRFANFSFISINGLLHFSVT
jgi:hypothetical protein